MSLAVLSSACSKEKKKDPPAGCAPDSLSAKAGKTGSAFIFDPDPIVSSGNPSLLPSSGSLDSYRKEVALDRLTGKGVLEGRYVSVTNGIQCDGWYGAFDLNQKFQYSHQDFRFQEAMSYSFGDRFQALVDEGNSSFMPKDPLEIVAHCVLDDDAFYFRGINLVGKPMEGVCLGDSVSAAGASYADDAFVVVHEIQHGNSSHAYSPDVDMSRFYYDEGGALSEGVSDFASLIFNETENTSQLDSRIFSRWALGTFAYPRNQVRGVHRCPMYDSSFPNCDKFPNFSETAGNISYVYPDGLGWPFPKNYTADRPIKKVFESFLSQEEIHQTSILISGTLWDAYQEVKKNHSGDEHTVKSTMLKWVMEAIRHLPIPDNSSQLSPINYIEFAQSLRDSAGKISFFTSSDLSSIDRVLTERGLYHFEEVPDSWMEIGEGTNSIISQPRTPGVFVMDDPILLRRWLIQLDREPKVVPQKQDQTANFQLDPGEVAAVWFDIKNTSSVTAGSVVVNVSSNSPEIEIMDSNTNIGILGVRPRKAQIIYSKINGTRIVSALNSTDGIRTGNSYFATNPFFSRTPRTAIWIRVSPDAAHGKTVTLHVEARASNGSGNMQSLDFPVVIR